MAVASLNQGGIDFVSSATGAARKAYLSAGGIISKEFAAAPDEEARRACFSYVNQGLLPGHEVLHWLEAEAHLIAERKLTRVHDPHHRI